MAIASPLPLDPHLLDQAILWLDDPSAQDVLLVGAKAAHLSRLTQANFRVPRGFVVTTTAHQQAALEAGVQNRLHRLAKLPVPADETNLSARLDELAATAAKIAIAPGLAIAITDAYRCLEPVGTAVAVRSSTAEGQPGSHPTFTWISGRDGLLAAVRACWVSLQPHEDPAVAVVVQRMVDADRSGVVFRTHPGSNTVVVKATFGLGEGVVCGEAEPDTYVLDGASMQVRSIHAGYKTVRYKRGGDGHTIKEPLPEHQAESWALSDDEATQVARLASDVAEFYGQPVRIEWAFDGQELWLLQAREDHS